MLSTQLVALLLCCSEISLALQDVSYNDIEQLVSSAEFNIHELEDFQIGCYISKLKMKKISFGCKKCTCKDDVLECLIDAHSCDAEGTCYGDKDSWFQDDKNCTCNQGAVICKSLMMAEKSETDEHQDTNIGAGHIPLNFTYNDSLFDLQWRNPNKRVIRYSFHMTVKGNSAQELLRKTWDTSSQQVFDSHQQVCFREYSAEVTDAEFDRTYVIGDSTKIGIHATPCPAQIYYIVLIVHIIDRCPMWTPGNCDVANDICDSDSECPESQVCCIVSNCGRGCTNPHPYGRMKTISSQVKILDLTGGPSGSLFFLDEGFNAAGTRLCLVSHMLTLLTIVLWVYRRYQ